MRPKLHAYSSSDFTHMLAAPASSSDGYPQIHTIQSSKGYDN